MTVNDDLASIERLIEEGDLDGARRRVASLPPSDDGALVVRLRLALADGTLTPDLVMQRLTQMMRKNPDVPGARSLYQHAAQHSYDHGRSSPSHSHPPPPVDTTPGKPEDD